MGKIAKKDWVSIIGVALLLVVVALIVFFFTSEKTTISGDFSGSEKTTSINCKVSTDFSYPFFRYDNSDDKSTEINVIFSGGKLDKVTLVTILNYDNADEIITSEANNHAAMNISFADAGLGADAFSSKFSKLSSGLKYSIFSTKNGFSNGGLKYFLLEDLEDTDMKVDDVKVTLEQKGFQCVLNS